MKEYYRGTSLRTTQIGRRTEGAEPVTLGSRAYDGSYNLAPGLVLEMVAPGADLDHLQALSTALTKIHTVRPGVPTVKALLNTRGLCPPHCAPPLALCTADEVRHLTDLIAPLEQHLIPRATSS